MRSEPPIDRRSQQKILFPGNMSPEMLCCCPAQSLLSSAQGPCCGGGLPSGRTEREQVCDMQERRHLAPSRATQTFPRTFCRALLGGERTWLCPCRLPEDGCLQVPSCADLGRTLRRLTDPVDVTLSPLGAVHAGLPYYWLRRDSAAGFHQSIITRRSALQDFGRWEWSTAARIGDAVPNGPRRTSPPHHRCSALGYHLLTQAPLFVYLQRTVGLPTPGRAESRMWRGACVLICTPPQRPAHLTSPPIRVTGNTLRELPPTPMKAQHCSLVLPLPSPYAAGRPNGSSTPSPPVTPKPRTQQPSCHQ
jgi:hypothetical protein